MYMMIRSKDKVDALSLEGVDRLLKFNDGICRINVSPATAGLIIKGLKKQKGFEIIFMPDGVEL